MKVCPIASGSSGNCIYAGDDNTHILLDAGISRKRMVDGLQSIGVAPEELSGICITHEHSDHISGLEVFIKKYHTPVYATAGTIAYIRERKPELVDSEEFIVIEAEETFSIGELQIKAFATSHDAAEPVGYTVQGSGGRLGLVTDLGYYDEYIVSHLKECEILILESNHDISMLQAGRYPYQLKKRILGEAGHLSNTSAGDLLCQLIHDKLRYVYLAHLSEENNYPDLAFETVRCQLQMNQPNHGVHFKMAVAKRKEPSPMVDLCEA